VAKQIQERFDNLDYLYDLGDIEIKMSGCMNACGHHHVGHIGILGVDKHGEEWYQITLGGSANGFTALGEVIGPSVPKTQVAATIERIVEAYRTLRAEGERFIDTFRRVGLAPFQGERLCDAFCGRREMVADDWIHLGEEAADGAALIVPLAELRKDAGRWWQWSGRLGVRITPHRFAWRRSPRSYRGWTWWRWSFPAPARAAATRRGDCCASA